MIDYLAAAMSLSTGDPAFWLPLVFFAGFILVSFLGMVLDGFDIGVGCLTVVAPAALRGRMLSLLNPWRDANELWLLMGLGFLATAFPFAWGALLGQLYIPLVCLALGFFMRSVCFEWRLRAPQKQQYIFALGFALGSVLLAFAHGLLVAQIIVQGQWQGGYFWFSLLLGLCAVAAYGLLGATWLMMREAGVVRVRAVIWARRSIRWFAAGVVAASVVLALENAGVFLKWTEMISRWVLYSYWGLILVGFIGVEMHLQRLLHSSIRTAILPFVLTVLIFLAVAFGFIFSFFPFFILDEMTVWDAAAPQVALVWVGYLGLLALPFVLLFNVIVYRRLFGRSQPPLTTYYP